MTMHIQEEKIEEIRTTNDIVDVVSEYVQLKKQGRNFFGLCPFHDEKTPSFSVTQEKQIFHCFGCGKGGNVITLLWKLKDIALLRRFNFLLNGAVYSYLKPPFKKMRSQVKVNNFYLHMAG